MSSRNRGLSKKIDDRRRERFSPRSRTRSRSRSYSKQSYSPCPHRMERSNSRSIRDGTCTDEVNRSKRSRSRSVQRRSDRQSKLPMRERNPDRQTKTLIKKSDTIDNLGGGGHRESDPHSRSPDLSNRNNGDDEDSVPVACTDPVDSTLVTASTSIGGTPEQPEGDSEEFVVLDEICDDSGDISMVNSAIPQLEALAVPVNDDKIATFDGMQSEVVHSGGEEGSDSAQTEIASAVGESRLVIVENVDTPAVVDSSPKHKIPSGYRRLCVIVTRLTNLELKLAKNKKFCKFLASSPRVYLERLPEAVIEEIRLRDAGLREDISDTTSEEGATAVVVQESIKPMIGENGSPDDSGDTEMPINNSSTTAIDEKIVCDADSNIQVVEASAKPSSDQNMAIEDPAVVETSVEPVTPAQESVEQVKPQRKWAKTKKKEQRKKLKRVLTSTDPMDAPFLDIPGMPSAKHLWNFRIKKKAPMDEPETKTCSYEASTQPTSSAKDGTTVDNSKTAPAPTLPFPVAYSSPLMRLEAEMAKKSRNDTAIKQNRRGRPFGGRFNRPQFQRHGGQSDQVMDGPESAVSSSSNIPGQHGTSRCRIPLLGSKPPASPEKSQQHVERQDRSQCGPKTPPPAGKDGRRRGRSTRSRSRSSKDGSCRRVESQHRKKSKERSVERSNNWKRDRPSHSRVSNSNCARENSCSRSRRRCLNRDRSRSRSGNHDHIHSGNRHHTGRRSDKRDRRRSHHHSRSRSRDSERHQRKRQHSKSCEIPEKPISPSASPISDHSPTLEKNDTNQSAESNDLEGNELLLAAALYLLKSQQQPRPADEEPVQGAVMEDSLLQNLGNLIGIGTITNEPAVSTDQISTGATSSSRLDEDDGTKSITELCILLEMLSNEEDASRLGIGNEKRQRAVQLVPLMKEMERLSRTQPGAVVADTLTQVMRFVCESLGLDPTTFVT